MRLSIFLIGNEILILLSTQKELHKTTIFQIKINWNGIEHVMLNLTSHQSGKWIWPQVFLFPVRIILTTYDLGKQLWSNYSITLREAKRTLLILIQSLILIKRHKLRIFSDTIFFKNWEYFVVLIASKER